MSVETSDVCEGFLTVWTLVWLLPCVNALVFPEVLFPCERFSALSARVVGLFRSVTVLVLPEMFRACEHLPALLTAVRRLSYVSALVQSEVSCLREFLPAEFTLVGLLFSGVSDLVLLETRRVQEHLTALSTMVWLLSLVKGLVFRQASLVPETVAANGAAIFRRLRHLLWGGRGCGDGR